jgi:hypothetical protein
MTMIRRGMVDQEMGTIPAPRETQYLQPHAIKRQPQKVVAVDVAVVVGVFAVVADADHSGHGHGHGDVHVYDHQPTFRLDAQPDPGKAWIFGTAADTFRWPQIGGAS